MTLDPNLSALIQRFFTDRLLGQLGASQHTVAGYRDAFRLLFGFAGERLGRAPCDLCVNQLDAPFLGDFLAYLECDRGNSVRTRNNRLSALRAFFRYVALNEPTVALHCQRILAIPTKRYERGQVEFLSEQESVALVESPDLGTWIGRRDRALLLVAVQTGLRNNELISLRRKDVKLGTGAHVRCLGKGRKMRCTPLRHEVAAVLKEWMSAQGGDPNASVFPSSRGGPLSSDALQRLVAKHATTACRTCPSLKGKTVTPHTLRHTMAMNLLRNGVDLTVIALWLGHESTDTVQIYLHADMQIKEKALAYSTSSGATPDRYKAPDPLLAFLENI